MAVVAGPIGNGFSLLVFTFVSTFYSPYRRKGISFGTNRTLHKIVDEIAE
jgi:hypothetical protein